MSDVSLTMKDHIVVSITEGLEQHVGTNDTAMSENISTESITAAQESGTAAHSHPLVTIGMPVYNEQRHLRSSLDSLLAQDYRNFEVVIVDNASTDSTGEIGMEYAARDKRVRYYRNEISVGGICNFNRAVDLARGEHFTLAAGHDLRHPTFLSRCMAVMEHDASVALCHTQARWIDEDDRLLEAIPSRLDTRLVKHKILRLNVVLWTLELGFPVYGLIKLAALRQTHMYKQVVSPDITLLAELSLVGTFAFIEDTLFFPRLPLDYGNWNVYLKKHFEKNVSARTAHLLYWRMIYVQMRAVAKHLNSLSGKLLAGTSVLVCMLTKWRWFLVHLWRLK